MSYKLFEYFAAILREIRARAVFMSEIMNVDVMLLRNDENEGGEFYAW